MSEWLTCRYCPLLLIDNTLWWLCLFLVTRLILKCPHKWKPCLWKYYDLCDVMKMQKIQTGNLFQILFTPCQTHIDWLILQSYRRTENQGDFFLFIFRIIPNIIWKKIINFRYIVNVFNLVYNFAAIFRPFSVLYLECYFSLPAKTTLTALFSIRMSNSNKFDIEKFQIHLLSSNTCTKRMRPQ